MKILSNSIRLLPLLLMLVGNSGSIAAGYPNTEQIGFFASNGTVSTWNETAAEDYLIPNSQVIVSGRALGTSNPVLFVGGALGGLLAVQADRSRNAEAVADVETALQLNFAQTLAQAIQSRVAARSETDKYTLLLSQDGAQITLLPLAKLTVLDGVVARLSFRLSVRTNDDKKDFYYIVSSLRPVVGDNSWSEGNSKATLEASTIAFGRLVDVLLDDIAGKFSAPIASTEKTLVAFRANDKNFPYNAGVLLKEYPDFVAASGCMNRQIGKHITLIERDALAPDQDPRKLPMRCGSV